MLLSSFVPRDSTPDIVDILPCRFDEVTLPALGAAFFQQGWLAQSMVYIHPSGTVALGDVGYVTEAGDFVVVDEVHHLLQAESGTLSWRERLMFDFSAKILEDTSAEMIISRSGKSYHRRRQGYFPVSLDLINRVTYF